MSELDELTAQVQDLERQVDLLRREVEGLRLIKAHIRSECDRALGTPDYDEVIVLPRVGG